jgi:hypothetical protein
MIQIVVSGIAINKHQVNILGFIDDLNILSESLEVALYLTIAPENVTAKVRLHSYTPFLIIDPDLVNAHQLVLCDSP